MEEVRVGEKIEVVEKNGRFHFVLKGSNPQIEKGLTVDRDINFKFEGDANIYTLIGGHPDLVLGPPNERANNEHSFSVLFSPGKCFEILN